jgi:hypothetical protein
MSQENLNNLENAEILKLNLEKVEQKEVSQEELLNWLDNEGAKFKLETQEELSKSNTVNLDQSTFEKIKNETNIENDLNVITLEAQRAVNEASKQVKDIPQKTMAELRAPNITKKLEGTFANGEDFSEANRIALKINDLIETLPVEQQEGASGKLKQLLNNKDLYYYKELHDILLKEKRSSEVIKQDVENKSFTHAKDFDGVIKQVEAMGGIQGSSEFFTAEMIKDIIQGVRSGNKDINSVTSAGGLRSKIASLLAEPDPMKAIQYGSITINGELKNIQTQYLDANKVKVNLGRGWEIMDKDDLNKLRQESDNTRSAEGITIGEKIESKTEEPLSKDEFLKELIYTRGMSSTQFNDYLLKSLEERRQLLSTLVIKQENSADETRTQTSVSDASVANLEADKGEGKSSEKESTQVTNIEHKELVIPSTEEIVTDRLIYKDVLPERAEINENYARQEDGELKENYKNYAESLKELIQQNPEKLKIIKTEIRNSYEKIMTLVGIPSSVYGKSETWIDWDLAKQAYLAKNSDKSNSNYTLGNPLEDNQTGIKEDIINRHVGWEVLGYAKHDSSFIDTLDRNKDSYQKVVTLINEGIQSNKLSSYKLVELGKLMKENRS